MILQITREVNDEEQEGLIDGISDITISKENISYTTKQGIFEKEDFKDEWKEVNRLVHIYLLNDEGKTIKRIYNSKK